MAKVHVCNVLVLDNPASFMSKLEFEITFECIEDLPEDLVSQFFARLFDNNFKHNFPRLSDINRSWTFSDRFF